MMESDMVPEEEQLKWYAALVTPGYENRVKSTLERSVRNKGMEDLIQRVEVPTADEEVETRGTGKKKIVNTIICPGYVFVKMVHTPRTWGEVRNTSGVTGWVGPEKKDPIPLDARGEKQLMQWLGETPDYKQQAAVPKDVPEIKVEVGEAVRINDERFENFEATVAAVFPDKGKVQVLVDMFGKETPVELDADKAESLD